MNKTPRLSKSGIEYLDYVWNFYSGCRNSQLGICPMGKNCWALKRTQRFKHFYPNGFEPTFYPEAFLSPMVLKKPSIIGVAFMGDLFGDWVNPDERIIVPICESPRGVTLSSVATIKQTIFGTIRSCPQHTFLFLTKCPWNLPRWSPFPDNCWVGVTATDTDMAVAGLTSLSEIETKVKYVSFEPLLTRIPLTANGLSGIDWVIIGAQTKPYKPPEISWVEEIETAARKAGIAIFEKDNLKPLLKTDLIQELPSEKD